MFSKVWIGTEGAQGKEFDNALATQNRGVEFPNDSKSDIVIHIVSWSDGMNICLVICFFANNSLQKNILCLWNIIEMFHLSLMLMERSSSNLNIW